ncbi:MAG TPA: ABC transporter ATP-binding protein [Cryptosporangiaceae bacterium]|nr:ABC transporter ATP-binding protein [Cryptosporangiaceae bacterium]
MTTVGVHALHHAYGRTPVLSDVNFSLEPGVTGLLGPNGAGKTTLIRMLATVLAPDSGKLRLLGRNPQSADDRLAIRRQLGYMPQEPGFYRHFTAFEFVDYVAILKEMTDRRVRHDEVRRVLDRVGLADVAQRKIRKLSGGMRRRVALAQALLGDPELLILDEPTAGLDPEQRLRFREIVSSCVGRQTVVLSTHQTEDVAALCQRVVVLDRGVVRFDGAPSALKAMAEGAVWSGAERDPAAELAWRTGDGTWRHIGHAPPAGAEAVPPTLEDAYLLLVGGHNAEAEVAA